MRNIMSEKVICMDRVARYWEMLVKVMREQERLQKLIPQAGVESILIVDPDQRVVHLLDVGWRNRKRVNDTYIQARIKDGKIWIEDDGTERGIANDLVAAGVPKSDIVLAFYAPEERRFGEFAVG
jgi:hypothetical protein